MVIWWEGQVPIYLRDPQLRARVRTGRRVFQMRKLQFRDTRSAAGQIPSVAGLALIRLTLSLARSTECDVLQGMVFYDFLICTFLTIVRLGTRISDSALTNTSSIFSFVQARRQILSDWWTLCRGEARQSLYVKNETLRAS